ncbi:hypothetical protein ACWC10_30130 [Streptomyces sp. NPDC001595]
MTENTTDDPRPAKHQDTSLTRRRALAVTGGTVVTGGLGIDLHAKGWSPRGSAGLLAGALFLDALSGTR